MKIDGKTKLFGIIGNPVEHSLSPAMHNAAFAHLGLNCAYLPLPTNDLAGALQGLKHLGIAGASVTIPYKEQLFDYLDEVDPIARKIGAVNTVLVKESESGRKLVGSNTDWLGSNRALEQAVTLRGSHALILGAGGAARAVGFGLLESGARVSLSSRTESSGRALAEVLDCDWHPLDGDPVPADILINATSVGMQPHDRQTPSPADQLPGFTAVMDIVYAPLQTRLLREAEEAGCRCITGLEMLLFQGAAQFETWTRVPAPVDVMRAALLGAVSG